MGVLNYVKGSYNELVNKVSWPSWQELFNSSILVLIGSLLFAIIIFLMDGASNNVISFIYKLFAG